MCIDLSFFSFLFLLSFSSCPSPAAWFMADPHSRLRQTSRSKQSKTITVYSVSRSHVFAHSVASREHASSYGAKLCTNAQRSIAKGWDDGVKLRPRALRLPSLVVWCKRLYTELGVKCREVFAVPRSALQSFTQSLKPQQNAGVPDTSPDQPSAIIRFTSPVPPVR